MSASMSAGARPAGQARTIGLLRHRGRDPDGDFADLGERRVNAAEREILLATCDASVRAAVRNMPSVILAASQTSAPETDSGENVDVVALARARRCGPPSVTGGNGLPLAKTARPSDHW